MDNAPEMSFRYRVTAGLLALLCLASGCARSLSGTWQDTAGLTTYQFARDGSVVMTILGTSVRGDYQIQGDRVVVNGPQGTVVLRRDGDRLSGPTGLELTPR
jgi:hypothetical protein